jgi:hypothetical protein
MVEAKGAPAHGCQVNGTGPAQCQERPEVKLADTSGTAIWACLTHAEEALLSVHGAFIASPDDEGLAAFPTYPPRIAAGRASITIRTRGWAIGAYRRARSSHPAEPEPEPCEQHATGRRT